MNDADNASAASAQDGAMEVPWNLVVPEVDIHLVGYGNRLPNDFTLELLAVLQRCKRIFGVPPVHAPSFKVPPMESLLHLYSPDRHRAETYRDMVETVLAAAAADPPVGFATYGSAMVGTYATHRILEVAPQRGLTVHVTNATSSFDGIWADFNIDPCRGFEIWEATMFLRLEIVPNTRAHLLLPQAPMLDVSVGIDLDKMQMQPSSTVPALRDRLLRFYPPDHEVHFDTTGSGAGPHLRAPDIETVALRDLDHPGRQQASTLIVPRLQRAELDFDRPPQFAVAPE
ncbi:MAG: SAM-dependent methyltransferase [Solirubrobacteraceae bacterium]